MKKCPFCGGYAAKIVMKDADSGNKCYSIMCTQCGTGIFRPKTSDDAVNCFFETIEEAQEIWEMRAEE